MLIMPVGSIQAQPIGDISLWMIKCKMIGYNILCQIFQVRPDGAIRHNIQVCFSRSFICMDGRMFNMIWPGGGKEEKKYSRQQEK